MRISVILTFLIQFTSAFGQYQPLKGLDLESGEYTVLAIYSESDKNSLRDSLREWCIDDIQLLKELQTLWVFDEEAPHYACGYHYSIQVCKNGREVDEFSVNMNCGTVVNGRKSYKFDNQKLRCLLGKKIRRFKREKHSMGILKARSYLDSIRNNPGLIYAPEPEWMKYEGAFGFTYNYPEGKEVYFPQFEKKINKKKLQYSQDSILVKIEAEIRKAYPGESFEVYEYGGSLTEIFVHVVCNKSLEEKFKLYPRNEYNYWEPFEPHFEVYWK